MQERGPQWDPMSIDRVMPVEARLFVIFMLFMLVFFVFRLVQLTWFAWKSRRLQSAPARLGRHELSIACIRVVSLHRGATLTLLIALAVAAAQAAEQLKFVATEKSFGPAGLAGSASELLSLFVLGAATSALMYAGFAIFEARVSRLRANL